MEYLWASLLVVLNVIWLLTVVAGLPGTWLMVVGTALLAWWTWPAEGSGETGMFGIATLVTIVALAVVGEIAEFLTGVVGARKAGATRRGSIGALIGAFVGAIVLTPAIPIPVLGTLVGACAGACLGAWAFELWGGRTMSESAKSGVGAGVGVFTGRVIKVGIGVAIWIVVAVAAFA